MGFGRVWRYGLSKPPWQTHPHPGPPLEGEGANPRFPTSLLRSDFSSPLRGMEQTLAVFRPYFAPTPTGFLCSSRSGVSGRSSQSMSWSATLCSTTTSSRWQPTVP